MAGGARLLLIALLLLFLFAVFADASASDAASAASPAVTGPPVAEQKPVVDDLYGHKITDLYRWLENGSSPETHKWVDEENTYTRSLLDPLPEREQIRERLTQLLSIGTLGA
ncbi:MAG TPA: hypothetical protein VMB18_00895, partial [Terriglobales bacterium]|nr:hypothetical protein [Terriglobales bacterium]